MLIQRPHRPRQNIGLAHGAQIADQGEQVRVADRQTVHIGDRQGEPGPLQQAGAVEGVLDDGPQPDLYADGEQEHHDDTVDGDPICQRRLHVLAACEVAEIQGSETV